jgi:hypothetical protein
MHRSGLRWRAGRLRFCDAGPGLSVRKTQCSVHEAQYLLLKLSVAVSAHPR